MTILDIPAGAYAEGGSSGETEYVLWLCTIMEYWISQWLRRRKSNAGVYISWNSCDLGVSILYTNTQVMVLDVIQNMYDLNAEYHCDART